MHMPLCSRCHKNVAVVFISKMEEGSTSNEGYCLKCAKELGLKPIDGLMRQMGITEDDLDQITDEMTNMHSLMNTENDDAEDEEIKIVRTKRFGMKPMYPEDACIQMELSGHDFFVFRNAENDEVNVVYKRKGHTYGLIEPEC